MYEYTLMYIQVFICKQNRVQILYAHKIGREEPRPEGWEKTRSGDRACRVPRLLESRCEKQGLPAPRGPRAQHWDQLRAQKTDSPGLKVRLADQVTRNKEFMELNDTP